MPLGLAGFTKNCIVPFEKFMLLGYLTFSPLSNMAAFPTTPLTNDGEPVIVPELDVIEFKSSKLSQNITESEKTIGTNNMNAKKIMILFIVIKKNEFKFINFSLLFRKKYEN